MDGGNYMMSNAGKVMKEQQWGDCVKEESLCTEFQWPAKNYACNFCKREFKSAQALGGHMNVHRRDRARMRLLPSWEAENNSYPNPNFSLPPPTTSFFPPNFRSNYSSSLSSSMSDQEEKKAVVEKDDDDDVHVLHVLKKKKKNLVSLELKMGILEGGSNSNSNEDLDLELRL